MKFARSFFARYMIYFLVGICILLVLEVGGMVYINNVYLSDNSNYSEHTVKNLSPTAVKYKSVAVDATAADFQSSYDGRYVSWRAGGIIKVADLVSGEIYPVESTQGMTVNAARWLYDRDRLAITQTGISSSGSAFAKLYSYDAKSRELEEIRNTQLDKELKVSLTAKTDTVTALDMSYQTGVTYMKTTTKAGSSKLWNVNSYTGVSAIGSLKTQNVGAVLCLKMTDQVLYENKDNGRVYSSKGSSYIDINGKNNLCLLGIDSGDRVYFGQMKDQQISAVYYGNVAEKKWTTVSLSQTSDPADIYITYTGDIYVNNSSAHSVLRIEAGSTAVTSSSAADKSSSSASRPSSSSSQAKPQDSLRKSYTGRPVCYFEGGFVTLDSGKISHIGFSGS